MIANATATPVGESAAEQATATTVGESAAASPMTATGVGDADALPAQLSVPATFTVPCAVAVDDPLPLAVRAPVDKAVARARRRDIVRRFGMHVVGTGVCCFIACFFLAPMVALLIMTMGKRGGLMGEERAAVVIPSLVVALCSVTGVAATVYLVCAMLLVCLTAEESSPALDAIVAPQPTVVADAEPAAVALVPAGERVTATATGAPDPRTV